MIDIYKYLQFIKNGKEIELEDLIPIEIEDENVFKIVEMKEETIGKFKFKNNYFHHYFNFISSISISVPVIQLSESDIIMEDENELNDLKCELRNVFKIAAAKIANLKNPAILKDITKLFKIWKNEIGASRFDIFLSNKQLYIFQIQAAFPIDFLFRSITGETFTCYREIWIKYFSNLDLTSDSVVVQVQKILKLQGARTHKEYIELVLDETLFPDQFAFEALANHFKRSIEIFYPNDNNDEIEKFEFYYQNSEFPSISLLHYKNGYQLISHYRLIEDRQGKI